MTRKQVEYVWIWKYNTPHEIEKPSSIQKAVYGRFADKTYTKDYLQFAPSSLEVENAFHFENGRAAVEYRWIGGSLTSQGSIEKSVDRYHLKWATGDIPECFKMSLNPSADGPFIIAGDPNGETAEEANRALRNSNAKAQESNTLYYLFAIKLADESNVLHLRVYIENPTKELSSLNISKLPTVIVEALGRLKGDRKASICISFDDPYDQTLETALNLLSSNPNLLLVGPPGTGKTVLLNKLRNRIANGSTTFDPEDQSAWSVTESGGATKALVFHPSYSYENFVIGLMPKPIGSTVTVEAVAGPLVQLAYFSRTTSKPSLLILDEINRGNAAAIFGESLALLDADKRDSESVHLPFGSLGICIPEDKSIPMEETLLEDCTLMLPSNLWIVGAMNSSDRSAVPLDAALRRRFSVLYMPPDYEALTSHLNAEPNPNSPSQINIDSPSKEIRALAVTILKNLNKRINLISGEDFELGQSFFWNICIGDDPLETVASIADEWDNRIAPTLRMNYRDDDFSLANLLGTSAEGKVYEWTEVSEDLQHIGTKQLRLIRLTTLDELSKIQALKALAGA